MRKYIIFSLLFLCFSSALNAQVKTVYYLGDKLLKDTSLVSTFATSFAVYGKVTGDSLYSYKRFDIDNNLMTTGFFKDEDLSIPHGEFNFYSDVDTFNDIHNLAYPYTNKNIFVSERGQFEDGLRVGKWVSYYPDGKILVKAYFENGLKEGEFISYDSKGRVFTKGKYVNDKREGEWIYKNGRKKIYYVNDVEQKKVNGSVTSN